MAVKINADAAMGRCIFDGELVRERGCHITVRADSSIHETYGIAGDVDELEICTKCVYEVEMETGKFADGGFLPAHLLSMTPAVYKAERLALRDATEDSRYSELVENLGIERKLEILREWADEPDTPMYPFELPDDIEELNDTSYHYYPQ
jgi:hypothetical protein